MSLTVGPFKLQGGLTSSEANFTVTYHDGDHKCRIAFLSLSKPKLSQIRMEEDFVRTTIVGDTSRLHVTVSSATNFARVELDNGRDTLFAWMDVSVDFATQVVGWIISKGLSAPSSASAAAPFVLVPGRSKKTRKGGKARNSLGYKNIRSRKSR
jgi:hypothetical protein